MQDKFFFEFDTYKVAIAGNSQLAVQLLFYPSLSAPPPSFYFSRAYVAPPLLLQASFSSNLKQD